MHILENEFLRIEVINKGAELKALYSKSTKLEYLWGSDPAHWAKSSPVLFPIVGTLKNNGFIYNDQHYSLPRHGFARDMDFELSAAEGDSLTFTLESDPATLKRFPFGFRFDIVYSLEGPSLSVNYRVHNPGISDMYFSVGGHPAFRLPLEDHLNYGDYYFEFSKEESALRWPISADGLINPSAYPFLKNTSRLDISRDLFYKDALVFKHLNSQEITLKTDKSEHGLRLSYPGFPYIGLWAAKDADFVCIEPWCGIADSTEADQQLMHKEGIQLLTPSQTFSRTWTVTVF